MTTHYDVIVIGLGAMGSATLYQLSKQAGTRVLGIEQFTAGHALGSSHGETRITRLACPEGASYVPLARRSQELWAEIARTAHSENLFHKTGGVVIAEEDKHAAMHGSHDFFQQTCQSARENGIAHEVLSNTQLRKKYPQFNVSDKEVAYYEPTMGVLLAEKCIHTQLALATQQGASTHFNEKLLGFKRESGNKIRVTTDVAQYSTSKLVLSMGLWLSELEELQQLLQLVTYRQVVSWFKIEKHAISQFQSPQFPAFIWNLSHDKCFYGFPLLADSPYIKLAIATCDRPVKPNESILPPEEAEISKIYQRYVQPLLSNISPQCLKANICRYSVTPTWQFVIDFYPGYEEDVIFVAACSGHGFKHSAAVGEALAQQLTKGFTSTIDVMKIYSLKARLGR